MVVVNGQMAAKWLLLMVGWLLQLHVILFNNFNDNNSHSYLWLFSRSGHLCYLQNRKVAYLKVFQLFREI
jgi:hypothetical protein